ncbi:MAG TPA: sigma-54 dependent transcriptional regulator [Oligoflexia bacterium]|nr:sigma-54 dependent transcriptional regulator [Oligoflexia bacterium]HMP47662.1 sigma-54 dependent transcriptional regulator [Oligoflexia bacterium]
MLGEEKPRILLVDDDAALRDSLQLILKSDFNVKALSSGNEALEELHKDPRIPLDILLLDIMMPGIDGLELLKQVKDHLPDLPVLMVSASNTVKSAVEAMKLGAVDFVSKPFQVEELIAKINQGIEKGKRDASHFTEELEKESISIKVANNIPGDFGQLVGLHPLMQEVYSKVKLVGPRDTTVLITGESGTGKELIAKELHLQSSRKSKPFVAINCAAIPESLVESELFGHEKGSFTHAVERRLGHFELAHGGTIFLDEIGELIPSVQVKLLRVLQEREFYRVGRSRPIEADVRIIAATNRSLERAVEEGRFRQDLYFRVHVVSIDLPPLRKRKEDVPRLVEYFIKKLAGLYGDKIPKTGKDFIDVLLSYHWPGNVRELENVIESILALSTSAELQPSDIPQRIRGASSNNSPSLGDSVLDGIMPFEQAERIFETDIITKALEKADYVQTKAADILGISRRILKYKMDKLGINCPDGDDKGS